MTWLLAIYIYAKQKAEIARREGEELLKLALAGADLALQCALLHDVLEDTRVPYARLHELFGEAGSTHGDQCSPSPFVGLPEFLIRDGVNTLPDFLIIWMGAPARSEIEIEDAGHFSGDKALDMQIPFAGCSR